MSDFQRNFSNTEFVRRYVENGPPAFMPGHAGALQMSAVLFQEAIPSDAHILVVGAGGGLDTKALCEANSNWLFTGVDPSKDMLALAKEIIGSANLERTELIEGLVHDVVHREFDGAICMLVLGLLADDGTKLETLQAVHARLKPDASFIVFDQCLDRYAKDFDERIERYGAFAALSGVPAETIKNAKATLTSSETIVPISRNEVLFKEAGFQGIEIFYQGMAWTGWVMRA